MHLRTIRNYLVFPLLIYWGYKVVYWYIFFHMDDLSQEVKMRGWEMVEIVNFLDKLPFFDKFLSCLVVFYLLYIGYSFFVQERNKLRFTLTPALILAFNLILMVLAYLFFMFEYPPLRFFVENNVIVDKLSPLTALWQLLSRGTPNLVALLLISLLTVSIGSFVLNKLKMRHNSLLVHFLMSSGVGYAALILFLLFAAFFGFYVYWFVGLGLIAGFVLVYKQALEWIEVFFTQKIELEFKFFDIRFLAVMLLMIIISYNFIFLLRYMPIGWDDIGTYMNNANLLVGYGELISGVNPYYWELVMGLGLMLRDSVSLALMLSFWPGLYNILLIYAFARTYVSEKVGLMAAVIFYTLPMVQHFSFADMKIDGALFFFAILSLFCLFHWKLVDQAPVEVLPEESGSEEETSDEDEDIEIEEAKQTFWTKYRYLILAGSFAGISIGIKLTTLYLIFTIVILIGWHYLSILGAFGLMLTQMWVLMKMQILPVIDFVPAESVENFIMGTLIVGLIFLILAVVRYLKKIPHAFVALMIFATCAALPFIPWLVHTYSITGKLSYGGLIVGKNVNRPVIDVSLLDVDTSQCTSTAYKEEVYRYLQKHDDGQWERYWRLPWRMMTNELVDLSHVNISYLFLLFIPFLFLFLEKIWREKGTRYLFLFMMFFFSLWLVTARGIVWYGLPGFLALCIFIELLVFQYFTGWNKRLAMFLLLLSLLLTFYIRIMDGGIGQRRPIFDYIYGKYNKEETGMKMLPNFDDIANIVAEGKEKYPDRYYLYRIGTFITYFIPFNDQFIAKNDPQIDFFMCLLGEEDDNQIVAERLKKLGFRYMMVDLYTASIEKDTKGTLHQKMTRLLKFLNDPSVAHIRYKQPGYAFVELID